jgi:hypothetical protein
MSLELNNLIQTYPNSSVFDNHWNKNVLSFFPIPQEISSFVVNSHWEEQKGPTMV